MTEKMIPILIKFTPEQLAEIDTDVAKRGVNRSEWVRQAAQKSLHPVRQKTGIVLKLEREIQSLKDQIQKRTEAKYPLVTLNVPPLSAQEWTAAEAFGQTISGLPNPAPEEVLDEAEHLAAIAAETSPGQAPESSAPCSHPRAKRENLGYATRCGACGVIL